MILDELLMIFIFKIIIPPKKKIQGGGFKDFLFSPLEQMIQFDYNIFFKWVGGSTTIPKGFGASQIFMKIPTSGCSIHPDGSLVATSDLGGVVRVGGTLWVSQHLGAEGISPKW